MKKLLFSVCFATFAPSIFAQGTIVFGNHIPNSVVAPIYGPNPADPSQIIMGNDPHGFPAGTIVYYGAPLGTLPGDYIGTFTAELWAGPTANSLAPVPGADAPIVTQGFFATLGTPVAIPGVPAGFPAFLQVRVWDNQNGTVTSWAAAVASGALFGASAIFQSPPLAGGTVPPDNMVGLTSFNIHYIPEPSSFPLAGLGFALLWIFRRRAMPASG